MKEHKVTMVLVAPEGTDIDMLLYRMTKHSNVTWWTEGEPEVSDYEGEE